MAATSGECKSTALDSPAPPVESKLARDERRCPWCGNVFTKDNACNWVTCGLVKIKGRDTFMKGWGCGRQWCFACSKKLCSPLFDPASGAPIKGPRNHSATCCIKDPDFEKRSFCLGGHNSHCPPRSFETAPPPPAS